MAAAVALAAASPAQASDSQRVVVLVVGAARADGEAIAAGVASHLSQPYSSTDASAFRGALGTAVRLLPLATRRRDKDAEFVARARAAERSAQADSAIVVFAEKSRKAVIAHVWAIDARGTGKAPVDQSVRLGAAASAGDGADAVWSAVAAEFPAQAAEPTPAPTPSAAEAPSSGPPRPPSPAAGASPAGDEPAARGDAATTAPASAAAHPAAATRATSLAVLQVAMEGGLRHFSYVDRLTPSLRPYNLSFAPLFAIHGEVYPFARMAVPVLSGFGATGSYARAFALSSEDAAGEHVGTTWQTFDIGARERLRLGDSVILGIDLGYGGDDFTFDTPVTATAQLPSAQYRTLRAGLDGRVALGALSVRAAASYLDVLSTGDFGRLFPRTSVGGVEAELGLAYTIAPTFELSLDVAYTRFFYSLLPQPGDTYVAGGALDQMGKASLGFAHLF
jgi:hypothetical protein